MKTRSTKILRGLAASISLLAILSGCGASATPINSGGKSSNTKDWGSQDKPVLDPPDSPDDPTPPQKDPDDPVYAPPPDTVEVRNPSAKAKIAAGAGHTCVLDKNGAPWCAGLNASGQLGNASNTNQKWLVKTSSLTGAVMIAAGGKSTCALDSDRSIWCWGDNTYGQLGNNSTTSSNVPVKVSSLGTGIKALAVGMTFACAIDSGGTVRCWGANKYGQLGNNKTTDSSVPVSAGKLDGGFTAIAAGGGFACAISKIKSLYCWGYNANGRLGVGSTSNKAAPSLVGNLEESAVAVSAGGAHACAIDVGNNVWCWGNNTYGQLGNGTTGDTVSSPVNIGKLDFDTKTIAAGYYHTCATDNGGYLQCWGYGGYGALGNGSTSDRTSPDYVGGLSTSIKELAVGGNHSTVIDAAGVQSWGHNGWGDLANGTTTNSFTPVTAN